MSVEGQYQTIVCEKTAGVVTIRLNRPARKNALSAELKREVAEALDAVARDDESRVVIITGGPDAFSAGADIKERAGIQWTQTQFLEAQRMSQAFYTRIERLDRPVIAAVSGVAVGGGCELALACDLRIASETARFGLPEIKLGVIPSAGGTQRLPRLIGAARAKELIFTGDFVDAQQALGLGLVNRVVPVEQLMPEALELANRLAERPPLALRFAKRAINAGLELELADGLELEAHCAALLYASEDRKEGLRAFVEKRKPVFKGR